MRQEQGRRWAVVAGMGLLAVGVLVSGPLGWAKASKTNPRQEARVAVEKGLKWLEGRQGPDGAWLHKPGITALVLTTFAHSPQRYTEAEHPFIGKALRYLVSLQKPDGSISDGELYNYNTAVSLMALAAVKDSSYEAAIKKAHDFILHEQSDEKDGYTKKDVNYGGIGYEEKDDHEDLSNTQMALDALKASAAPEDASAFAKAIIFIQRCQNRSESNDQPWAANDGGFTYQPSSSKEVGSYKSYGSMTYAGLKSYIYAGVKKEDPRVQAAYKWIQQHYTLDENPGMGGQGLFYAYHTFAKTMQVWGEPTIKDSTGEVHYWAPELIAKLASLQKPDGTWQNSTPKWWENMPELATTYAVLALEEAVETLPEK